MVPQMIDFCIGKLGVREHWMRNRWEETLLTPTPDNLGVSSLFNLLSYIPSLLSHGSVIAKTYRSPFS